MGMIGIKLTDRKFTAACAKILRKYRNISISNVKNLVLNNDYLTTCDYIDISGIKSILMLQDDLNKEDIQSVIYENDEITSIKLLNNLLVSYEETAKQVEEDMNNEALAQNEFESEE